MDAWLWLSFTLCLIQGRTAQQTKHFKVIWGVPSWKCVHENSIDVTQFGIVQNQDQRYSNGSEFAIFYENKFGVLPRFEKYDPDRSVNGGLPQLADLEKHLEVAARDIEEMIPDPDYSGVAVIDIEEWRPLYKLNWGPKAIYQQESMRLVRQREPGLSDKQVLQRATKEFDQAAMSIFLETLRLGQKLRPRAKWGYYLFPMCNNNVEKTGAMTCNAAFQKYNDDLMFLYRESTALFPSIYYYDDARTSNNWWNSAALILETNRVMSQLSPKPSLYVFSKFEYNPYNRWSSFYTFDDQMSAISLPMRQSADGLIFWSTSNNMKPRCSLIKTFVQQQLGPIVSANVNYMQNCRQSRCSGNGECFLQSPLQNPAFEDFACECDKPYHGYRCAVYNDPSPTTQIPYPDYSQTDEYHDGEDTYYNPRYDPSSYHSGPEISYTQVEGQKEYPINRIPDYGYVNEYKRDDVLHTPPEPIVFSKNNQAANFHARNPQIQEQEGLQANNQAYGSQYVTVNYPVPAYTPLRPEDPWRLLVVANRIPAISYQRI